MVAIEWLDDIDSTNSELLRRFAAGQQGEAALVARKQSAGRGRAGRSWVSPPNANLYFSWRKTLAVPAQAIAPLTLALGVAVLRALKDLTPALRLKWPNDIYAHGAKLGGILIELAKADSSQCTIVAGVGLNVRMPSTCAEIDQRWSDLFALGVTIDLAALATRVLHQWQLAAEQYAQSALVSFLTEFAEADYLRGQSVHLFGSDQHWLGGGISADGRLILISEHGEAQRFAAGEVRVRGE
jgi:BirA family transcriptional regulator, biotin operon repressor / biotin---[acetyl-CoA-carboxylase] ligase